MFGACSLSSPGGWGAQKPPLGVRIDRGHPLAQGMQGRWLLNEASGQTLFDCSGQDRHGSTSGQSGGFIDRTVGGGGLGLLSTGDFTKIATLPTMNYDLPGREGATVSAVVSRGSPVYSRGYIFFLARELATYFRFVIGVTSSHRVLVYARSATESASTVYAESSATLSAERVYCLAAVADLPNNKIRIYIDGRLDSETNVSFAQTTFADWIPYSANLAGAKSAASAQFVGTIYDAAIWNRALTGDEIRQLHTEPYGMFEADWPLVTEVADNIAYRAIETEVFNTGAIVGERFHTGTMIGQDFHTGTTTGLCHG